MPQIMDETPTNPLLQATEMGQMMQSGINPQRRRAAERLASVPLPLPRASLPHTCISDLSKQTAADLRARIMVETSLSSPPTSPTSSSPINGDQGGYHLARGLSYGTMATRPSSELYTIHEVAEPSSAEEEKLAMDIESQQANREVAGFPTPKKWSLLIKLWVGMLVLTWTWFMLLIIFGRLDVVVHLFYTPINSAIRVYNFLTTPSGNQGSAYGDVPKAPFSIAKGHHGHREHSGGGGIGQKSAASSAASCIWWSAIVAATIYLADALMDGLL